MVRVRAGAALAPAAATLEQRRGRAALRAVQLRRRLLLLPLLLLRLGRVPGGCGNSFHPHPHPHHHHHPNPHPHHSPLTFHPHPHPHPLPARCPRNCAACST
eukprot:scaffold31018_cov63-Phaeocystis_antarctica.AAC.8